MANPVITTLTNYIQQERLPLISKAVLGAKSIQMFSKQTGIKTSEIGRASCRERV